MFRTWAIVRREFLVFAKSKAYVIGTLFGPLMIGLFFVLPIYFLSGGAERAIAIVDASGLGIGGYVSEALFADPGVSGTARSRTLYTTQVIDLSVPASVRGLALAGPGSVLGSLKQSVEAKTIDGYLWLPNGLLDGAKAQYEGSNATNFGEMSEIRSAVQRAVQRARLEVAGIDPDAVGEAFQQVGFEAKKAGDTSRGSTGPLVVLGQLMGFVIYFLVIIYGYAVARSIQEEKKDRIVEILLSSIRPENLMAGKVLGIAAAGILQVTVWAVVAGLALTLGRGFLQQFEGLGFELPQVSISPGGSSFTLACTPR
jgi:ABC-2 type transport system permease protein